MTTRAGLLAATLAFAGAAGCAAATAWAQSPAVPQGDLRATLPPVPPPPPGAQGTDTLDGTVRRFTLSATGEPDGVLLDDGTEVHTPPALAQQLTALVRPGDEVHVQGWRSPTRGVLAARSLTDARSGGAVVDNAPPGGGASPLASAEKPPLVEKPGMTEKTLTGRVLQGLHDPQGEIDGAVLGDGTELRLVPSAAQQAGKLLAVLLRPGERLAVAGYALDTPYGEVINVHAIGKTPDSLTPIAPGPAGPPPAAAIGAPAPAKPPTD